MARVSLLVQLLLCRVLRMQCEEVVVQVDRDSHALLP